MFVPIGINLLFSKLTILLGEVVPAPADNIPNTEDLDDDEEIEPKLPTIYDDEPD